jgi:O-antigen/teichoic acid export membrane protein
VARHAQPTLKIAQNSFFLVITYGATAILSFLFWAVVARLFSASRVGLATSLISAISLISYLSLCGFNSTLIRFAAPERARNSQITLSLTLVGAASLVFGSGYLLGLPLYGQRLLFIRSSPWQSGMFVAFCACAAINVTTDSIFIGARIPQYNLLKSGIIQGLAKLALPIFLVGFGAVGIVEASGGGYLASVIASLVLMRWRLKYRLDFKTRGTGLRKYARYSLASYVSALLNLLPTLVLPLIVLQKLGAEDAGYYYIAFQVAGILTAVCSAVGESMFAEASHDPGRTAEVIKRSAKMMCVVQIPAAAVFALGSGLLLSLFGAAYAKNAQALMVVLCAGSIAVLLNTWASNALRVHRMLRPMIWSNVALLVVTVGMTLATASRGLVWVGWSWDVGNLASGLVAVAYIPWRGRASSPAGEDQSDSEQATAPADQPVPLFVDAPTVPLFFPWNQPGFSAASMAQRPRQRDLIARDPVAHERVGQSW